MHDAIQAFIESESDEKLRLDLQHPVRTRSEVKYVTGDKVLRDEQTIIGRDQSQ